MASLVLVFGLLFAWAITLAASVEAGIPLLEGKGGVPSLAEALGLSETDGPVVTQVKPASPADAAGIRTADVIVSVDGRPVSGSADLRNTIGLRSIGTDAVLGVIRDGADTTIRVRIGSVESSAAPARSCCSTDFGAPRNRPIPDIPSATARRSISGPSWWPS